MLNLGVATKAALLLCAANTLFLLWYGLETLSSLSLSSLSLSAISRGRECRGWKPDAAQANDPPRCLRARQFREMQAFHLSGGGKHLDTPAQKALLAAERCALGVTACPERPIILIDFYFWHMASRGLIGAGEAVWGWPIIDAVRAAGFVPIFINGRDERGFMSTWDIARALPSSIHMYWTDANAAVRCLLDPRCVRPIDYVPHTNASLRFPDAGDGEVGVLPAWRVFGISYWGARPNTWKGTPHPCRDWGQCGDAEWPFHALGNRPTKDTVKEFGRIAAAIAPTKLVATTRDFETDKYPLPPELTQLGPQEPDAYVRLVGGARALLGISLPVISPTPYEALCRGVPVVLPYAEEAVPNPDGWSMYGMAFQHGPLQALGEPHVYSYAARDADDLLAKLQRALRTPIGPFIPDDMTTAAVHARVRQVLLHDWEGEYTRIVHEDGMPAYPDEIVDKCFYGTHLAPCSSKYPVA
ncbi:hypothetical protein CspeluHIS016_0503400 [Cutaneotrichosporon spelunceum]|uniref:Uncharacterized protein n=1 Tax=Cutaneotrichosporon spelunceum TaxID=1672016 RepID=A0AAD3TX12_9TREE|nr:hypothetical protein CspeluHIS016_0503400 [Cutaneotrichosporon spelunceum]